MATGATMTVFIYMDDELIDTKEDIVKATEFIELEYDITDARNIQVCLSGNGTGTRLYLVDAYVE